MKKKFNGKVAIITGASSGIGLAIANMLFEEGAIVYDISRTVKVHDCIKEAFEANINDSEKINQIMQTVYQKEGKIDFFINNAGFGIAGAIEYSSPENIYKQIDTNLSAYIVLSGMAVKYLKETKGKIVNISSVGGIIPLPYQATYSATKAGVDIFSRALANELKQYGITVTSILPGDTKTGFTSSRVIDNEISDKLRQADIRASIAKMEKDEQKGMTPQSVANAVKKVLKKRHSPLRKTVGFQYKCVAILPRLLPLKFVNYVVRLLYCKKAKRKD